MATIPEYYQYLFFGKITNSLSSAEAAELEAFFDRHPEALNEYEELLATLPPSDLDIAYCHLNRKGYWKQITPTPLHKAGTTNRIRFRWLTIAAIIAGITVTSIALFIGYETQNKSPKIASANKDNCIELKLGNGKVINLSETKGQIHESGLLLDNSKEVLSYRSIENHDNGINSVTVPTGMDYKIRLSDGSLVWMNSTTQLQFPTNFTGDKREITLSGEAYLEVTKDSKKPFIVQLPDATVKVTGTAFNVNTYDAGVVSVALVEGSVNLIAARDSAKIKPGIVGIYNSNSETIIREPFNVSNILSWQKGLYYFEAASLDDLSKVLSRWFGVTTVIDNADLKHKSFAGVLDKNKPIQVFLRNLEIISKIKGTFDKDGVLHFR